jgi:hypothetical protein
VSGKSARTPAAPKPKQAKSKWKMNTQVATNKPVLPGGVASPTTTPAVPAIKWVRGLITKFHGVAACPYEITWDTQPEPIMHRINAEEVADLVANFLHCIKLRLLQGYVGLDLLWQKDATKVTSSASSTDQPIKPSLQYGMVRNFDPLMDKYKVLFRTGIWTWKTEEDVKEAQKFTDIVITGQHGSWSFEDAQDAAQQSSTILESQQDQLSTTNDGDALASSQSDDSIEALTPSEVSAILFPNKPKRVLPARVSKQANVKPAIKVWKCGKTKVATMNGCNTGYSNLPKNRTGWTVGTLRRDDGDVKQPYLIEWDVKPIVSNFVSYEEMPILVRHHKQCSARKLINMFCVGMDLLWKTPHPANPNRVRWVTVMFWDAKQIRYKLMFRDGSDEWVTGETLDAAIKCNELEVYTALEKTNAAMENWSPALLVTLKGYGLYCTKHVGPPSPFDGTIAPILKGLPLQQYPLGRPVNSSKTTPTPPLTKAAPAFVA